MEIERIVREELLRNSYDVNFASLSTVCKKCHDVTDPGAIIHKYGKFYIHIIEDLLATDGNDGRGQTSGFVYSAFREGFIRIPNWQKYVGRNKNLPPLGKYATLPEFEALCLLLGPQGMRCIEHSMLKIVSGHASTVRAFLDANRNKLVHIKKMMLEGRHHSNDLIEWSSSLEMTSDFIRKSISIGHALRLRELISRAKLKVLESSVPEVCRVIQLAHSQYPENMDLKEVMAPVDCLASSCGIAVGSADHTLVQALSHLRHGPDCDILWGLLPYAYGACFASHYWTENKQVSYLADVTCRDFHN